MDTSLKRISITMQHLKNEIAGHLDHHRKPNDDQGNNLYDDIATSPLGGCPNVEALTALLDGDFKEDRERLCRLFQNNEEFNEPFLTEPGYTNYKHRERVLVASKMVADENIVRLEDMKERPDKFLSWFETVSLADMNIALKFAVQYNLWGGTVLFLGTEKHHAKYLAGIQDCSKLGVFGLTELGHGSNVNGMETTATYDENTKEFIINSPTWTSQKYWPGNIATHGQFCTAFARLILKGRDHGVHAFVVPIRTPPSPGFPYGQPMPGIVTRDIGLKSAFNGIDNGGLSFKQVRIPLDNMLDRFSRVTESGEYQSSIPPNRHFGAMMSVFYIGRLCISLMCLVAAKTSVSIALHYSHNRKQFGEPGGPEQPIIRHSTQQRRLIPSLARCYAIDFAHKRIIHTEAMDLRHSYSSGIKAIGSWDCSSITQLSRESIGGQGFRLTSRIPVLRDHIEVGLTGEGDNTILCQQTSKYLLANYHKQLEAIASQKATGFTGELEYINNIKHYDYHTNKKPITFSQLKQFSYQQLAFQKREYVLLQKLYNVMYTKNIKMNSVEWYRLWNQHLSLTLKLTRANVDRFVHQFFLEKIQSILKETDVNTVVALKRMCSLDALELIQKDLGVFVSNGILATEDNGSGIWFELEREITEACSELTPYCLEIASAFKIPQKFHPYTNSIE